MPNDTKERILKSALEIFARDGYSGANIKDISQSVGIVKSAFYRHYESKEEIWNSVLDMMIEYYDEHFGSADNLSSVPKNTAELLNMTMRMVNFTVNDEKVVLIRRIIMTEQFRDEKIKKLATRYFIEDSRLIFEKVFAEMMLNGTLKCADVRFLAFSYTAPITALVHLCDREPALITETMAKIKSFAEKFIELYGVVQ